MKIILLFNLIFLVSIGFAQNHENNQLVGNISDYGNLPINSVIVTLYNDNKLYQTKSDSFGNYCIKNIESGVYSITYKNDFMYLKYYNFSIDSNSAKNITKDILIKQSCANYFQSLKPITGRFISNSYPLQLKPNQNINAIAAYFRGVDSRNGETPSIKGARPENTAYYIDGVRVNYNTGEVIIGKQ
jgi:hypothetical protein